MKNCLVSPGFKEIKAEASLAPSPYLSDVPLYEYIINTTVIQRTRDMEQIKPKREVQINLGVFYNSSNGFLKQLAQFISNSCTESTFILPGNHREIFQRRTRRFERKATP